MQVLIVNICKKEKKYYYLFFFFSPYMTYFRSLKVEIDHEIFHA